MALDLVQGWTGGLSFTLKADGTAVDLTGSTVAFQLVTNGGTAVVSSSSGVTVTTTTGGVVKFTPASTDTLTENNSPYQARFKVTSGSEIVFFPNGEADEWTVRYP